MAPADWQHRTISDFAERVKRVNVTGEDLPPLSVTKHRGVVLQSEKYSKRIATDPRKYFIAKAGEFVFDPMSLYYGAIGRQMATDRGLASPDYVVFKIDGSVDPVFLNYLLRSPSQVAIYEANAEAGNLFGKRRRVYWSVFETFQLALPPLSAQRKIADILASLDATIEATQAVIDQLGVVKNAMMQELLTRGLPGRHTRFKNTEIGEVPETWAFLSVGDVLRDSSFGTSVKCTPIPLGLPVLRIPNVVQGRISLDDLKYAQVGDADAERFSVRSGDLLIVRTNGNPAYVGRTAVVRSLPTECLYASYLIRLCVDETRVLPEFLHLALQGGATRKTMAAAIRTSAGNYNLNTQGIRATKLAVPSLEEQQRIVAAIAAIDSRELAELEVGKHLRFVKAGLTTELLSGRLRVSGVDTEGAA